MNGVCERHPLRARRRGQGSAPLQHVQDLPEGVLLDAGQLHSLVQMADRCGLDGDERLRIANPHPEALAERDALEGDVWTHLPWELPMYLSPGGEKHLVDNKRSGTHEVQLTRAQLDKLVERQARHPQRCLLVCARPGTVHPHGTASVRRRPAGGDDVPSRS